jgi:hypothetical protein
MRPILHLALVAIPVVFGSIVVVTVSIIRYKLKKKELETRGSNPELGAEVDALRDDLNYTRAQLAEMQERLDFAERMSMRCVTISITHEHSWPRCRNASTSQSGCSPGK